MKIAGLTSYAIAQEREIEMEKIKDLVRCTNCIESQVAQPSNREFECPRCGRKGEVIQGGFLVFAPEASIESSDRAWRPN